MNDTNREALRTKYMYDRYKKVYEEKFSRYLDE